MVFHGSRLVFMVPGWFSLVFDGSRLVFHGSRLVFMVFMVLGWLLMVFLQNVPTQTVSWPDDPF